MEEIWKDILGFEGFYQVSSHGIVRSITRLTDHAYRPRTMPSKVLKPSLVRGYKRVCLYKGKKKTNIFVARLVAIAFIGVPAFGMTVNHIDMNKENNHIENLEWLSSRDNTLAWQETFTGSTHILPVILRDLGGDEHIFKTEIEACKYLGRHKKYIQYHKIHGIEWVKSADGTVYIINQIKTN